MIRAGINPDPTGQIEPHCVGAGFIPARAQSQQPEARSKKPITLLSIKTFSNTYEIK